MLTTVSNLSHSPRPRTAAVWALLLASAAAGQLFGQPPSPSTQKGFELSAYLPGAVGDFWSFAVPGNPEPWLLTVSEARAVGGLATRRWDDSTGAYQLLAIDPGRALLLLRSETATGLGALFEPPASLAPAVLEVGARYESESAYQELVDGTVAGQGRQRVTATVTGPASWTTAAGTFAGCLGLHLDIIRESSDGASTSTKLLVQLARGVGPVDIHSVTSTESADGVREEPVDFHGELEEAAIGDRFWPPDPP